MTLLSKLWASPRWKGVGILLFTLALIKIIRQIVRYRKMFKFYNSLPGEKDFHWIWGNIHKVHGLSSEERIQYQMANARKYKYFYRFWVGAFNPRIVVHHPETVKVLLKTSEPKPIKGVFQFVLPWLGEGLLVAGGERWARARRLLTPAFHFDILKPYVDIYNKATDILLFKIEQDMRRKESFEAFSYISLCTLDIILQCAMSYTDNIQMKGDTHPYVVAVKELTELWFERGRNPLIHRDFIYYLTKNGREFKRQCEFVHSVSEEIIEKRRKTLEKEGPATNKYLDFLDILLTARDQSGQGLTPLEIRNEVDTFLFEGHDTTASAISWILYSLATHPEIQDKVYEEIDAILDDKKEDYIDWSDLGQLNYLSCVIKEGMRLHCPVPFIMRQVTQPTTIHGVTFPKDTIFSVSLLNLHHNPDVWEDPDVFKPERFLAENMTDKDNYAFVPFSAGPRNCIGQHFAMNEEKVVLARILHKYRLELDKSCPILRKPAAVMRSANGIRLFAARRK